MRYSGVTFRTSRSKEGERWEEMFLALRVLGIVLSVLQLNFCAIWRGYNVVRVRVLGKLVESLRPLAVS
jgi:hypothetical protein